MRLTRTEGDIKQSRSGTFLSMTRYTVALDGSEPSDAELISFVSEKTSANERITVKRSDDEAVITVIRVAALL